MWTVCLGTYDPIETRGDKEMSPAWSSSITVIEDFARSALNALALGHSNCAQRDYGPAAGDRTPAAPSAGRQPLPRGCLLYTSDAADDLLCVDLVGRRL